MDPQKMSARLNKQLARLASCPKDYSWHELCTLLTGLGFQQSAKGGAAVMFRHPEQTHQVIHLHKPHGRNPPTILVVYVKRVVSSLKDWGYIDE